MRNKNDNKKYAIKVFDKQKIKKLNKLQTIQTEAKVMDKLDHPNIIHLYATIEDKKNIC